MSENTLQYYRICKCFLAKSCILFLFTFFASKKVAHVVQYSITDYFSVGTGPLVSTPLQNSFQRRRRLPPLGCNQHRLSWTLGGRIEEDEVQQSVRRESRQRWSLHLGEDSPSPSARLFQSPSRSLRASVSGELNGSRSRAGPWSPLCRGTPVRRRPASSHGNSLLRASPASLGRTSPAVAAWLGSRRRCSDAMSPVPLGGKAVLPELHTSTLIEHGDDPSSVQSVTTCPATPSSTRWDILDILYSTVLSNVSITRESIGEG